MLRADAGIVAGMWPTYGGLRPSQKQDLGCDRLSQIRLRSEVFKDGEGMGNG
mgnify:CR=1 FL=1